MFNSSDILHMNGLVGSFTFDQTGGTAWKMAYGTIVTADIVTRRESDVFNKSSFARFCVFCSWPFRFFLNLSSDSLYKWKNFSITFICCWKKRKIFCHFFFFLAVAWYEPRWTNARVLSSQMVFIFSGILIVSEEVSEKWARKVKK